VPFVFCCKPFSEHSERLAAAVKRKLYGTLREASKKTTRDATTKTGRYAPKGGGWAKGKTEIGIVIRVNREDSYCASEGTNLLLQMQYLSGRTEIGIVIRVNREDSYCASEGTNLLLQMQYLSGRTERNLKKPCFLTMRL